MNEEINFFFFNENKKKEWENLDPHLKKHILYHLKDRIRKTETSIALDLLCDIINDVVKRLDKLEKDE